jgi:hypothetical protein
VLSAVFYRALELSRAQFPPGEWSSLYAFFDNVIIVAFCVVAAPLMWLGSRVAPRAGWGRRVNRLTSAAGAVGLFAMCWTWALALGIPDDTSFEIDLPPGATVVERDPFDSRWEPAYGNERTALLAPGTMPTAAAVPSVPVVGVSVARSGRYPGAQECYNLFQTWASVSTLYRAPLVKWGDTLLPAGPAFELTRGPDGMVHYSYALFRQRRLALHSIDLCYLVVVTVPAGWPMTEVEARQIVETFRFR